MASWEYTEIKIDGKPVKAQAPIIVSASRSTDIPAFYADWFFDRLKKGFSAWTNPFNGVKSYVSYDQTRFIVFWSKNPRPLLSYLDYLKERNIKCYIQYTLNDYEQERLEKVPPLATRIETFKMLVDKLGFGSVVWRFDPMILTDDISVEGLLRKVQNIGDQLKGYTEKLVFSYADIAMYRKVKANLERSGIPYHEWTIPQMEEFADKLSHLNHSRGWDYQLATCGEKIDIENYGIEHNRCIDGDLIARLADGDNVLLNFISKFVSIDLFGNKTYKKDVGQRVGCGCMAAKDIGEYNTCPHLCEYCYANTTKQLAIENWKRHQENPNADTITGK
jgi:DNA repair photolyase